MMKIAVVRSAENLDYYDHERELSKKLTEAAHSDSRFNTTTVTAVAWDDENNWSQFTHIIPSVGLTYYKCPEKFLNWLEGLPDQRRVFNPPSLIKWNMSKIYLSELKEKGVPLPATVFLCPAEQKRSVSLEEVIKSLEEESGKPIEGIVVKNMMDAGGHSVHRIQLDSQNNGQNILDRAVGTYEGGVIVQEYLNCINTEGEWSVVYIDKELSHAMVKRPCETGFKVQGRFGGSNNIVDLNVVPNDVLELSRKVMESAMPPEERVLYGRIDIVRGNDGQPKLMELEVFEPELFLYSKELALKFLEAISKY